MTELKTGKIYTHLNETARMLSSAFFAPFDDNMERYKKIQATYFAGFILFTILVQGITILNLENSLEMSYFFIGFAMVLNIITYITARSKAYPWGALLFAITNTLLISVELFITKDPHKVELWLFFYSINMVIAIFVADLMIVSLIAIISMVALSLVLFQQADNLNDFESIILPVVYNIVISIMIPGSMIFQKYLAKIKDRKIEESKNIIHTLLDSTYEAIFSLDTDGLCLNLNNSSLKMLGYTNKEDIIGKPIHYLIHYKKINGETIDFEHCKILQTIKQGIRNHSDDEHFIRRDGTMFPVEYWSHPLYQNGKLKGAVVTFIDISERIKFIQELNDHRNRLSDAQRIAHLGHWDWLIDTGELYWSEEIYRIFGYIPFEFPPTYEGFLQTIHPDDRDMVLSAVDQALNDGQPYQIEHRIVLPDQSIRHVKEQGEVIADEYNNPVRMIGTVIDITSEKTAENQLRNNQETIKKMNTDLEKKIDEEINKSREKDALLIQQSRLAEMGEMIGHIAHQWRQPLNALNLLITDLKYAQKAGEINDEYISRAVEKGKNYTEKMSTTIDDFRNYFRPDKMPEDFHLNTLMKSVLSLIESTLVHYRIKLEHAIDEDLYLHGFPNELSQVLINTISNAKDAILENNIENGKVVVKCQRNEDNVCIKISDNGGGIPQHVMDRIFDPYYTTKEEGKGTGLGLYISKNIIQDHMHGDIEVKNKNEGAEFTFILPLAKKMEMIR